MCERDRERQRQRKTEREKGKKELEEERAREKGTVGRHRGYEMGRGGDVTSTNFIGNTVMALPETGIPSSLSNTMQALTSFSSDPCLANLHDMAHDET